MLVGMDGPETRRSPARTAIEEAPAMGNLLLEDIEYVVEDTPRGQWRRYVYPTGARFDEYKSHATLLGWPLVHYTHGVCPETGRRVVAKGVLALGRVAVGGVALGQASAGLVAIGQLGVGILFGLGQAACGFAAVGQLAAGLYFGLGQIVTGSIAIGQLAIGQYVLAQRGIGAHVWSPVEADPVAVEFFQSLARALGIG